MLNRILTVICSITVLATGYLTLSVIVLRPPRLNYQAWALMAGLFLAQSVLTLVTIADTAHRSWMRALVSAGGMALIVVGVWWVQATVTGSHFEGYALVLGSLVTFQGALTLLRLLQSDDIRRIVA